LIKKILLFSFLIIFIPTIIVSIFIRTDEVTFNFSENSIVRVYREKSNIIERVPIEEYIVGVVSGEMPISFELEALKAQAVASRSYVMKQIDKNKNKEYDVVDTVKNQVYLDRNHLITVWKESYVDNINKIKTAVLSTKGEYLTYNGKVAEALFFSTSPGLTENSEDIFVSKEPYLRSVSSTWDKISPKFSNTKTFALKEFCNLLNIECTEKLDITIINQTATGRIKNIKINAKEFTGGQIFSKLNLNSTYFEIIQESDKVIVKNKGYGHGVGMSQYGAEGMAREGYTYKEILKHYYKDIEIKKF